MALKKINSVYRWLIVIMALLSGCRSITATPSTNVEMVSKKDANILALGTLILDYHKKNKHWPENRVVLDKFDVNATAFLVNFDTLSFRNETGYFTVNYRFINDPSSPATVTFVDRDNTASEKFQSRWCHDVYSKSNVTFDGQLLFKYDNGYYTCL